MLFIFNWVDDKNNVKKCLKVEKIWSLHFLGGGFKFFNFHPDPWGNDQI